MSYAIALIRTDAFEWHDFCTERQIDPDRSAGNPAIRVAFVQWLKDEGYAS